MGTVTGAAPAALIERLPPPLSERVTCARSSAEELGRTLWWVGGGVRDLLLDNLGSGADLDLVLDSDPAPVAEAVRARLGGRLVVHERFLTVAIETPEGMRIDFARARSESYPRPGSLPRVEPAPVVADLQRRDFAVNSIALRLAPRPHELLDPCSGRQDLRDGRLRILHDRSFVDDPTRILRGVRFEARLGFSFDAATEKAARDALAGGALETLSSDRLRRELRLLFESWDRAATTLGRLEALGALSALGLDEAGGSAAVVAAAAGRLAGLAFDRAGLRQPSTWKLVRLALALACEAERREALVERVASAAQRQRLLRAPGRIRAAEDCVADPGRPPHRIFHALDGLDPEELLLTATRSEPACRAVDRYLACQRGMELTVRGSDLLAAGVPSGPAIGEALRGTRNARLDGEIGPEQELEFALEAARARSAR